MQQAKRCNDYNKRSDVTITTSEAIPEGGLLQSIYWADVLRAEGKRVLEIAKNNNADVGGKIYCSKHKLPLVGEYIYCPRAYDLSIEDVKNLLTDKNIKNTTWFRLDIKDEKLLKEVREKYSCQKAPHDMQPRQNFIIDIDLTEDELLARMKSKTRYNIRLAKKKGVEIIVSREQKYIDEFINLVEQTAQRKGVSFHQREHYEQMFKNIPEDILQLYVAKYKGEVIATNIVSFYDGIATYLHGATGNKHRNVMASFLLQWQAILDAKTKGIKYYDLGGVKLVESRKSSHFAKGSRDKKVESQSEMEEREKPACRRGRGFVSKKIETIVEGRERQNLEECGQNENAINKPLRQTPANGPWQGITKFKLGFSPNTKPFETLGSYDIILNKWKYKLYRFLQKIKSK